MRIHAMQMIKVTGDQLLLSYAAFLIL